MNWLWPSLRHSGICLNLKGSEQNYKISQLESYTSPVKTGKEDASV
jgi:hypothetical protein